MKYPLGIDAVQECLQTFSSSAVLGEPQTEAAPLASEPLAALTTRVAELRQRLRDGNN